MLLLFDIDGTLLGKANGAHRDALLAALLTVHGVDVAETPHALSPAGRTDGEIARTLLLQAEVPARQIDERARDVEEECARVYTELCPPDLSDKVLPGIADLLRWLSQRPDPILALVTGNYEAVARLKLSRAGIGHFFAPRQGAFGSDSEDRTDLPPLARRRAGEPGAPYPRRRTIVIGDTPRDIACAHADDLRCFAVATGPFETSELTAADAAVNRAAELRPLLEQALTG